MRIIWKLALYFFFLTGCNGSHKFWNISKFNLRDSALKDNYEIKLLYSSRGPGNNTDLEYYIQIVAVSQKTGDTVNILTTVDNGFAQEDGDKVFNYFDKNNIATRITQVDTDQLKDIEDVTNATQSEAKKISKVARDPNFDHIADNNYPTVIGSIGTLTK